MRDVRERRLHRQDYLRIESRTSAYEYKFLITNDDDLNNASTLKPFHFLSTNADANERPTRRDAIRRTSIAIESRSNDRMTAKTTHAVDDAEHTTTQTQTETEAFENNETTRPTTHANANVDVDTEAARVEYRLQGKAGYDRVLAALKKEQSTLRETRQYLFGRLLNLQLEEAVLRDHLNKHVNEVGADDEEA